MSDRAPSFAQIKLPPYELIIPSFENEFVEKLKKIVAIDNKYFIIIFIFALHYSN